MEITDLEKIDNFNWYYKDLFAWGLKSYKKGKRIVYFGEKIKGNKFTVVLKKIKIEYNYKEILKEVYFLACCQRSKYFIKLVDILLSEDKNYIFLILKDEGASLSEIIDYAQGNEDDFDYKKIRDSIKDIIFQIVCGLYLLHKNGLVHHDIKTSNILMHSNGVIKIADFGSVDKINNNGFGTLLYKSPEILLNRKVKEKGDMWAVGVIMVELYKKKYPFFENYYFFNNKVLSQLKSILSKYKIFINNQEKNINDNNIFYILAEKIKGNNVFENINIREELNYLDDINDPDALDLIKNLLQINPEKRFTAEQALNSNYFQNYKINFEQNIITYIDKDYQNLIMNINSQEDFVKSVEYIKQKLLGEVLFE